MTKLHFNNCCGIVDLQRGVVLITIFALLNKVSGFFGIPTIFDGADHLLLAETEKPKQNNELNNNKEAVNVLETSTLPAWKAESAIAIIILIASALIHVYFALVINSYANFVQKKKYYYPSSGIMPVPRVSTSGTALLKTETNSRRHVSIEVEDEDNY
ncbi:15968_t:CDS:2 [Funneliformis geosporum]|uniref:9137_t:CDS:1 n=1 Tax=Funneliformis geosporum TaxID=1117311 RepID=A0A9W4SHV8_9GLOM|nr:15968_t:CDS:2 [Funneliformis geosporum]CAI2169104.1 9137_t:CDS:2 [Funneliformis geosporum]